MKRFNLIAAFVIMYSIGTAQKTDTVIVDGETYIPVEGRAETPSKIEGNWILQSGLKKSNHEKSKEVYAEKPKPGTETGRTIRTTTSTENGVTTTTTETDIELVKQKAPQITPGQKNKMHKPAKPSISFYGVNETFTGFTGCNKFAGRYHVSGNAISLQSANPSTKMACIGDYDEHEFLDKIAKAKSFRVSNGRLQLLNGNKVLLEFARQ